MEVELKLSEMQGVLSPPQPLGSSLLLPRPWALLLRILLQQGVPEHLLQQLTQPSLGDESALESAVWSLFPEDCQKAWQAAPHRMGTAEAQVRGCGACSQPVLTCSGHVSLSLSVSFALRSARRLTAAFRKMGTAEAQVRGHNAYGRPVLKMLW